MLNRKQHKTRKIISAFLAAMYFFVVLFSSQLHQHKSDLEISISKKTDLSYSKSDSSIQNAADCLSCHFLATNHTVLPNEFEFRAVQFSQDVDQIYSIQEKIWDNTKHSFHLRGPPAIS